MDTAALIQHYGYVALFFGTFFEGEVMLSLGGAAASEGYLVLGWVMVAGAAGTVASDQVCFWSGRLFGRWFLNRYPRLKVAVERVLALFDRWRDWLVMGFQFVPGSCTVVPFALGLSTMPTARFIGLDLLSATLWTVAFSLGGYLFGAAMRAVVKDVQYFEVWLAAGVVILVVIASAVRRRLTAPRAGGVR
jgi:membrane protein DedA with SNARE-associated domain